MQVANASESPPSGRVFKIEKNLCTVLSQNMASAVPLPLKGQSVRNLRRERPERAVSPQPRATPWVSVHKNLRPVR